MSTHKSMDALEAGLPAIRQSPKNNGALELIVARPAAGERVVLDEGRLTLDAGLEGDSWRQRANAQAAAGANPDTQITIMNARVIQLLDPDRSRWPLAGDQLFVDLDLSVENLPPGQRLNIGEAVLEISPVPHTGCKNFVERFGLDAMKFVNSDVGKELHLRGIYAKVVVDGAIHTGDRVSKA